MSLVTCSLNCKYQIDGICELKKLSLNSLNNEKCPHFVEREHSKTYKNKDKK